ncbi:hypothetical protein ACFRAE_17395 [Sphingobacterium sp. HJSM2_6]
MAHKRIDQLTKDNIFEFVILFKANRSWTNKTYNHYLQAINTFLQHFIDNKTGYIEDNVFSKIKRLRVQKKGNLPM